MDNFNEILNNFNQNDFNQTDEEINKIFKNLDSSYLPKASVLFNKILQQKQTKHQIKLNLHQQYPMLYDINSNRYYPLHKC